MLCLRRQDAAATRPSSTGSNQFAKRPKFEYRSVRAMRWSRRARPSRRDSKKRRRSSGRPTQYEDIGTTGVEPSLYRRPSADELTSTHFNFTRRISLASLQEMPAFPQHPSNPDDAFEQVKETAVVSELSLPLCIRTELYTQLSRIEDAQLEEAAYLDLRQYGNARAKNVPHLAESQTFYTPSHLTLMLEGLDLSSSDTEAFYPSYEIDDIALAAVYGEDLPEGHMWPSERRILSRARPKSQISVYGFGDLDPALAEQTIMASKRRSTVSITSDGGYGFDEEAALETTPIRPRTNSTLVLGMPADDSTIDVVNRSPSASDSDLTSTHTGASSAPSPIAAGIAGPIQPLGSTTDTVLTSDTNLASSTDNLAALSGPDLDDLLDRLFDLGSAAASRRGSVLTDSGDGPYTTDDVGALLDAGRLSQRGSMVYAFDTDAMKRAEKLRAAMQQELVRTASMRSRSGTQSGTRPHRISSAPPVMNMVPEDSHSQTQSPEVPEASDVAQGSTITESSKMGAENHAADNLPGQVFQGQSSSPQEASATSHELSADAAAASQPTDQGAPDAQVSERSSTPQEALPSPLPSSPAAESQTPGASPSAVASDQESTMSAEQSSQPNGSTDIKPQNLTEQMDSDADSDADSDLDMDEADPDGGYLQVTQEHDVSEDDTRRPSSTLPTSPVSPPSRPRTASPPPSTMDKVEGRVALGIQAIKARAHQVHGQEEEERRRREAAALRLQASFRGMIGRRRAFTVRDALTNSAPQDPEMIRLNEVMERLNDAQEDDEQVAELQELIGLLSQGEALVQEALDLNAVVTLHDLSKRGDAPRVQEMALEGLAGLGAHVAGALEMNDIGCFNTLQQLLRFDGPRPRVAVVLLAVAEHTPDLLVVTGCLPFMAKAFPDLERPQLDKAIATIYGIAQHHRFGVARANFALPLLEVLPRFTVGEDASVIQQILELLKLVLATEPAAASGIKATNSYQDVLSLLAKHDNQSISDASQLVQLLLSR